MNKFLVVILSFFVPLTFVHAANNKALTNELLKQFENNFDTINNPQLIINAVTNNDIRNLSLNRDLLITHDKHFNYQLKKSGITNQKGSGRCWLFAGLNIFNPTLMTKLNLSSFELSEAYLAFWDKMEKSNLFLEEMIRLRDRPADDRELVIFLENPFGDGGWWHYVTALIEKYGVVPVSAMPETKQSSSTGTINTLISRKLRAFTAELRQMHKDGKSEDELRQRKKTMLNDIYTLLVYAYGKPPQTFTFRYEDKDSTISDPEQYTPYTFYEKYLADAMTHFVTLMNNPTKTYNRLYQVKESRNMADTPDLTMLNLPIEKIKQYCRAALLDSQAVWFACDVGKENYRDSGLLMTDIYDYKSTFGIDFSISKADRIRYEDSYPNHAMVLLGMDTASDGHPQKWLVENSWGTKRGDKGYWYMYDKWFDEYVYVAVIDERLLTAEDREKFKQKPEILPVWDSFFQGIRNLR